MSKMKCKYWEIGHLFMNCKQCVRPNNDYCKKRFGEKKNE